LHTLTLGYHESQGVSRVKKKSHFQQKSTTSNSN
jgi:hypothetical protein